MVDLEYYQIDEASGLKTKLNNAMSFGNMFKGTRQLIPITVYNNGDTADIKYRNELECAEEYSNLWYEIFGE